MPVGVIKDVKGPLEAYDATCQILRLEPGGPGYPGALFEWTHATEGGFRCLSVYDTMEHAQANVEAVKQAAVQVLAAQGMPAEALDEMMVVTFLDVHDYLTANPAT